MDFWSAFRRRHHARPPDPPTVAAAARDADPLPAPIARLLTLGDPGGPSEAEALGLLRTARATPHEGLVLDRLVQSSARSPLPADLALAVASALVDRGERSAARALLAHNDAAGSLLMRADLLAEDGDFASAVAMIERALLRDLDLPGARERRLAWRDRLGLREPAPRVDPATATVAAPKTRAPFELVRELARGGAGVVYLATDRELGRQVALKVYHHPARDRGLLLHEARVAASLEGPGVLRVFDIEPEAGWLALEWATLGALRDLLRAEERSSLVPLDAWLPSLVRALARVHLAGWVHHDVKPANVLMASGLEPWLADFGNARRPGEPSPPGSLGYVSPERLAGRPSDPRDDVYALGRVVEDVLHAVEGAPDAARWRKLAALCTAAGDARPRDAEAASFLLSEP